MENCHPGVQAGQKVRAMSTKSIEVAWDKLKDEFTVQNLVWQSVALGKKGEKNSDVETAKLKFEEVLREKHSNRARAMAGLQSILRESEHLKKSVNSTILVAAKAILK